MVTGWLTLMLRFQTDFHLTWVYFEPSGTEIQFARHLLQQKLKLCHYTPREALVGVWLLLIRDLGTSWGWVFSVTPWPRLAPGKGPQIVIVQEAGWSPEPVWTQRLKEKSFRLCRGSNLDRPVVQPVARHCTDWATRLTVSYNSDVKFHWSPLSVRKGWLTDAWGVTHTSWTVLLHKRKSWRDQSNIIIVCLHSRTVHWPRM
jgi:hypothetical protein